MISSYVIVIAYLYTKYRKFEKRLTRIVQGTQSFIDLTYNQNINDMLTINLTENQRWIISRFCRVGMTVGPNGDTSFLFIGTQKQSFIEDLQRVNKQYSQVLGEEIQDIIKKLK